ncbi:MAG: hypothetical protein COW40_16270 [Cytophagales bacterium CG17_big_fil_post_rev_8_21_14_2_50_40_13]|nr:MAG: hypothetical protein COW40_16270 [Cytophagales bacterium CG17_big_fil_post_rev_8_21_14_2_50_40_13]
MNLDWLLLQIYSKKVKCSYSEEARKRQSIFFSKLGDYLSSFNHLGEAPGQYQSIQNFWVKNDTVFIFEKLKSALMKYALDGIYLGEDKLPIRPANLYFNELGYVADMNNRLLFDSLQFRTVFLNTKMEVTGMANPFDEINQYNIISSTNPFTAYKDKLLYKSNFNDTVYSIDESSSRPLMKLDFGDEYYWVDKERRTDIMRALSEFLGSDQLLNIFPKVGQDIIIISLLNVGTEQSPDLWLNRKTGEFKQIDLRKRNKGTYDFYFRMWEGDISMASISSTDVADFIADLGEGHYKFRKGTTLEEIESSENPVLMWVKFKDFE